MAQIILDSNNNLIQGDFDNATINNRTKFKTTTTNATTNVYAVPNGSATSAGFTVTNAADPTNASKLTIATNGSTDTQIISGVNGSGTYLPMSFYTNNALAAQLTTAGNLTVTGSITATGGFVGAGGMTLLGTLTTTSGTTQTLSGLTLTNYKFLQVSFNNVGFLNGATGVAGTLNSVAITRPFLTQTESMAGVLFLDLSTGAFFGPGFGLTTTNTSTYQFVSAGNIAISTSTTSLSFGLSGEPFNRGTIKVYGVA